MVKPQHPTSLITEAPLTAEAREALLHELFGEELPHIGEIFIPDDDFYGNERGAKQAQHMLRLLCLWLGVKPGYVGLAHKSINNTVPDGQRYTIYVNPETLGDEFVLGAFLAVALSGYLLKERKQIRLPERDQTALLATASIMFGLGLVIANGWAPEYSWVQRLRKPTANMPIAYPIGSYSSLFRAYIKKHRLSPLTFERYITPWAARRLDVTMPRRASVTVTETRHKIGLNNVKLAGAGWLIIMVIGLSGFVLAVRVRPVPAKVTDAQEQIDLLTNLSQQCQQKVNYDRQYADLADIQTVRTLNAESLRCESLNNQEKAAERVYQDLVGSRN